MYRNWVLPKCICKLIFFLVFNKIKFILKHFSNVHYLLLLIIWEIHLSEWIVSNREQLSSFLFIFSLKPIYECIYIYCIENNNKAKEDTFVNLFAACFRNYNTPSLKAIKSMNFSLPRTLHTMCCMLYAVFWDGKLWSLVWYYLLCFLFIDPILFPIILI